MDELKLCSTCGHPDHISGCPNEVEDIEEDYKSHMDEVEYIHELNQ